LRGRVGLEPDGKADSVSLIPVSLGVEAGGDSIREACMVRSTR
jgi:hypothetical protein